MFGTMYSPPVSSIEEIDRDKLPKDKLPIILVKYETSSKIENGQLINSSVHLAIGMFYQGEYGIELKFFEDVEDGNH